MVHAGGLLRQFLLDDKGVVIIFTFGLSQASFEDNAERGLATAKELDESLAQQGLSVRVGITAGEAFCGLVGVPKRRCEYGVMGPSVNLAARLMGMCDDKGVSLLCCDRMHAELHRGDGHLAFRRFDHVRVKGYAQPVAVFHPQEEDAKLRDVKRMLAHVPIFSMLAPREQTQFLRFMREQAFAAGCEIITEGDEGDEFYILVSGTVRVTQWQDAGDGSGRREKRTLVECLSRGDSFGDVALIHGIQRTSTVTATSDAVCMSLDRTTFQKLFGGAMAEVISSQLERAAQASAVRINSLPPSARPPSPKRSASGRHIVTAQQRFAVPGGQAEAEAEAEAEPPPPPPPPPRHAATRAPPATAPANPSTPHTTAMGTGTPRTTAPRHMRRWQCRPRRWRRWRRTAHGARRRRRSPRGRRRRRWCSGASLRWCPSSWRGASAARRRRATLQTGWRRC